MRLDKLLANCGKGTRKEVKKNIRKGFVEVNGEVIKKDDFKVDPTKDTIVFFDEIIEYRPYVYLMLHKPKGYVSATKDNLHATVLDLIEGYETYSLFPVGRLDIDTEGLLLLSNDGDFGHKLLAPNRHHAKVYIAHVEGVINEKDIALFEKGVVLDTGYTCKPSELVIIEQQETVTIVQITIYEGKFHQIKKMFIAIDKPVLYLKRIKIRNLELDETLKLGEFRELSSYEIVDLMADL